MITAKVRTDPIGKFLSRQQASRLDDLALAMHPVRLDAVEPGALAGQVAGDDADPLALLPDGLVVVADPAAHLFADVPRGIIPDHEQRLFAQLGQLGAAPSQVLRGDSTDRAILDKAQPDLFRQGGRSRRTGDQQAVAGQRFAIWIILRRRLLNQPQHRIRVRPGVQVGLRHPAPPDFILKAQGVVGVALGQGNQPVAVVFFAHTQDPDW